MAQPLRPLHDPNAPRGADPAGEANRWAPDRRVDRTAVVWCAAGAAATALLFLAGYLAISL